MRIANTSFSGTASWRAGPDAGERFPLWVGDSAGEIPLKQYYQVSSGTTAVHKWDKERQQEHVDVRSGRSVVV